MLNGRYFPLIAQPVYSSKTTVAVSGRYIQGDCYKWLVITELVSLWTPSIIYRNLAIAIDCLKLPEAYGMFFSVHDKHLFKWCVYQSCRPIHGRNRNK
jgi:hypothetical protein